MPACVHTQDHDDDNWPGLAHRAHGSWLAIALIKRPGEGLAYTIPGHTCIIFSLGPRVWWLSSSSPTRNEKTGARFDSKNDPIKSLVKV